MAVRGLIALNGNRSEAKTEDSAPGLRSHEEIGGIESFWNPFARPPSDPLDVATELFREMESKIKEVLQGIMREEDLQLASISGPDRVTSEINGLASQLEDVKESFDDLLQRQILFSSFKRRFDELFRNYIATSSDLRAQAFSLISEGLRGLRAENLAITQIEALIEVMTTCRQSVLSRGNLIHCSDLLDDAGIETI